MKLVYKKGTLQQKLDKIRILDNLRGFVEKETEKGVFFSYEAIAALSIFPVSDTETIFSVVENKIVKGASSFKTPNAKNWGYSFAEYHESRYYDLSQYEGKELEEKTAEQEEKKDYICYYISPRELEKIGWLDANEVPDFVLEVFAKLDCMPDEIVND